MFDLDTVKKLVIANLNLSVRDDSTGAPTYSTSTDDTTYSSDHLTRACQSGATEIMRAIVETPGHHHRPLFEAETSITHGAIIPAHVGPIGVPRITPYSGATYTLVGKRKSIEEISSYRANPQDIYSETDHNASDGDFHSKLSGFYAIDEAANIIYFTGYSAVADIATFTESSYTVLPDMYYPLCSYLAIGNLKIDGDTSDVFEYYEKLGMQGLMGIRGLASDQPMKKTVGGRDSGAK